MKKLLTFILPLILFVSCEQTPQCEKDHTGSVTFVNEESSWSNCYIEIEWSNGGYSDDVFSYSTTFNDIPAGTANVDMTWEDDYYYYYNSGYIVVPQCDGVTGYCYWAKKSSFIGGLTITESRMVKKNK